MKRNENALNALATLLPTNFDLQDFLLKSDEWLLIFFLTHYK